LTLGKKMSLINPEHEESKDKPPLKRSKTGLEIEYHMLDSKGNISHKAHDIVDELTKNGDRYVTKEICKNMIEFGCYPSVHTYNPAIDIITSIQRAIEVCKKKDLYLYPFGTYPGSFNPQFITNPKYQIQEKIFGEKKKLIMGRAVGFHHHYSFPKGVFAAETKKLKFLKKSKLSRTLISSYNFEIATDPILTLFTQSSPFYQNRNLAKDSRMVVYRGGNKLNYMSGLYANHQQLGGLPPYKQTATDLFNSLQSRWQRWERELKKVNPASNFDQLYPYKLDITWNPVKMNKHGTIEQRGMDSNFLSSVAGVTVLLKFCLREIQHHFIEVLPADFGINEAFKIENGIMYIPPHTVVRNKLQKLSAYEGFSNEQMYSYAKRFFDFAQSVTPKSYSAIINPVKEMLESKKSTSDRILAYAKKKGYLQDGKINNEDSAELALHYADMMPKDLEDTKRKLEKLSSM
jgi:hypothetical protein